MVFQTKICSLWYKVPTFISLFQNCVSKNVLHFPRTPSFGLSPSHHQHESKPNKNLKFKSNVQWSIPVHNALYIQKQCNLPIPFNTWYQKLLFSIESQIDSCEVFGLVLMHCNSSGWFSVDHTIFGNVLQFIMLPNMKTCNLLYVDLWLF